MDNFLRKYKISFSEIFTKTLPDFSTEVFNELIKVLTENLGSEGLKGLQDFIKKRFISEAQKIVKLMHQNGAFDRDVEHTLKNHILIS